MFCRFFFERFLIFLRPVRNAEVLGIALLTSFCLSGGLFLAASDQMKIPDLQVTEVHPFIFPFIGESDGKSDRC